MRQYVWGTQYVDELIRVDINGEPGVDDDCLSAVESDAEDSASSNLDERYDYHQDANYNVIAVTDGDGSVVQAMLGVTRMAHANGRKV